MINQAKILTIPSGIRQKMTIILIIVPWILLISCHPVKKDDAGERIRVIFDTDIGGDIVDALALAMLYNYMDQGWIELLGVMSCKDNSYSPGYIDIMNNWYGYPDLPVGIVIDGVKHDTSAYARPSWDLTSVLFGVERDSAYFTISPPGWVSLGYEPDLKNHIVTFFNPDPKGKHRYLSMDNCQARKIKLRLVEMVTMDQSKTKE